MTAMLRPSGIISYARDAIGITMALGHREVACVVGHDFGAAVASYCALARPDYFRSLILMSPFGGVSALPFGTDGKLPEQRAPRCGIATVAWLLPGTTLADGFSESKQT
jgi:pimeloyl-ACP methyl ester carboxylesterase